MFIWCGPRIADYNLKHFIKRNFYFTSIYFEKKVAPTVGTRKSNPINSFFSVIIAVDYPNPKNGLDLLNVCIHKNHSDRMTPTWKTKQNKFRFRENASYHFIYHKSIVSQIKLWIRYIRWKMMGDSWAKKKKRIHTVSSECEHLTFMRE